MDSLGVAHGRIRGFDYIPAEVIKISRNKQHNYMILNKGFEDGIQEKSGIITRSGVVGIVDAVSAHHCYALSLSGTGRVPTGPSSRRCRSSTSTPWATPSTPAATP